MYIKSGTAPYYVYVKATEYGIWELADVLPLITPKIEAFNAGATIAEIRFANTRFVTIKKNRQNEWYVPENR